jgi:hypothetical protein
MPSKVGHGENPRGPSLASPSLPPGGAAAFGVGLAALLDRGDRGALLETPASMAVHACWISLAVAVWSGALSGAEAAPARPGPGVHPRPRKLSMACR